MKRLIFLVLLLPGALLAQGTQPVRLNIGDARLDACDAGTKGRSFIALDPDDDSDCTSGGGSADPHLCICDGSAYVPNPGSTGGATDHGGLTGLTDDDHTQYALLTGRGMGYVIQGGDSTGGAGTLTLSSTAHTTKGKVFVGNHSDGLVYDEVNKRVGIGTDSPAAPLHVSTTTGEQLRTISDGSAGQIRLQSYRDSSDTHALLRFDAARGSLASPDALQNGDQVFRFTAQGHDGTNFATSVGRIEMTVDGAVSTGTVPGKLSLQTAAERLSFSDGSNEATFNDGGFGFDLRVEGDTDANLLLVDASTDRVGIGTSTPSEKLEVNGDLLVSPSGTDVFETTTTAAKLLKLHVDGNSASTECPNENGGAPATGTLTPTTSLVEIAQFDLQGCTLTMGEGAPVEDGARLTIVVTEDLGLGVFLSDTSGVSELPSGGLTLSTWDAANFVYASDRWVYTGGADN